VSEMHINNKLHYRGN